ncbi:MAG: hypothetical protein R2762_02790 [Bryobacteraceae bacterium]
MVLRCRQARASTAGRPTQSYASPQATVNTNGFVLTVTSRRCAAGTPCSA